LDPLREIKIKDYNYFKGSFGSWKCGETFASMYANWCILKEFWNVFWVWSAETILKAMMLKVILYSYLILKKMNERITDN